MPEANIAQDTSEVAWLIFGTMGVVVLTLIGHAFYKDLHRIVKTAKELIKPREELRQKKRIMTLLSQCSDDELANIAFSLAAWPRKGFPDSELHIARPLHYRWDLKSGSEPRENGGSDPLLSMEYLKRNTRENLLVILEARLTNRSRLTLTWLEQRLIEAESSDKASGQGHGP